MTLRYILIGIITVIALLMFGKAGYSQERSGQQQEPKYSSHYLDRTSFFELHGKQAAIVMVGDSITAGAEWPELLNRHDVINRGIAGDTTEGILDRQSSIFAAKPKMIFFMAGINDISRSVPVDRIVRNISEFIAIAQRNKVLIVIQSVLLTTNQQVNSTVAHVNKKLKDVCTAKHVQFLDLNKAFGNYNGNSLDLKYTHDGLHLNGSAYTIWGAEVQKFLFHDVGN